MNNLTDQLNAIRRLPSPRLRRAIRKDAHITQADIATELHVHRMTIARWEAGVHEPRGEMLRKYVQVLDALREVAS